jgi:transposase
MTLFRKSLQYKFKREEKIVMSLKPEPIGPIPQETARLAKAVFPEGSTFMKMRDELGTLYQDEMFAILFPKDGQPALAPWRLALVTIMQFAERLSDRQAAHAERARLDWKYALGLELEDRGFDFSVLSEFRSRLIEGEMEYVLFETLLTCAQATRPHQSRRSTTDRCHPCTGGSPSHQSSHLCGRNNACRTQFHRGSCP